jgi:hypothetical protein
MCDHFPFWRPLTTVLVIGGGFAAWHWAMLHYTQTGFGNEERARQECQVAAAFATKLYPGAAVPLDMRLAMSHGTPLYIAFNPVLREVSKDGAKAILPRGFPDHAGTFFLIPPALDCSAAFVRRGLTVTGSAPPWYVWRVRFTRIVFSPDGQSAFVSVGRNCGNECGFGEDMVWRRRGDGWVLLRSRPTWVS